MTGAISSVNGLNTMNYGALLNDPYFQQAFNSPNVNAQQSIMNQGTMTQPVATQSTAVPTTQVTPSFKGASQEIAEEGEKKKSNGWKWALGLAAAAGLAFCGYKCYTKGTGEGLAKILDGAKQYLGGAKKAVKGIANGGKADEVFTIAKNGDDVLCTVPGRANILRGADAADDIAKIGGQTTIPSLADKASQLRRYTFDADGYTFEVVKGKVTKCTNATGDCLKAFGEDAALKSKIEGMIKDFSEGKNLDSLRDITFGHKANGVSRLFRVASSTETPELVAGVSKRFDVNSTAVKAYRQQYPQLSQAIDEFGKDVTSNFKVFSADKVTSIGTFKISGDKIIGIQTPTGFHAVDSDNYRALLFDNKEIFDGVLSDPKKFTNIVYQPA